jgi:hypothetical protein
VNNAVNEEEELTNAIEGTGPIMLNAIPNTFWGKIRGEVKVMT